MCAYLPYVFVIIQFRLQSVVSHLCAWIFRGELDVLTSGSHFGCHNVQLQHLDHNQVPPPVNQDLYKSP